MDEYPEKITRIDFDSERKGSGTMEWAEVTENICLGCGNVQR